MINAIAEEIGLEVEYQDTSFDTIFRDVAPGQVRHRGRGIDDHARARENGRLLRSLLRGRSRRCSCAEGSDIATIDDLAGKIVGAQDGTTGETYANDETDAAEVRRIPGGPRRDQRAARPARSTR